MALFGAAVAAAGAGSGEPVAAAFLNRLVGAWTGKAETTPTGPRPYNMTFKRLADGRVAAAAHPGRAIHRWWFGASQSRLHLTFLTTFQGNRVPQRFRPAVFAGEEAVFNTDRADRLTVRVLLRRDSLSINVYRRDRLHVAIRLLRQPDHN